MVYKYSKPTEVTVTPSNIYGVEDAVSRIPPAYKLDDDKFFPPRKGELFLSQPSFTSGFGGFSVQTASWDYSIDEPRLILRKRLTDVEKAYGKGATIESVWRENCSDPENFEAPQFGEVPEHLAIGVVPHPGGLFVFPAQNGPRSSRSHWEKDYIWAIQKPQLSEVEKVYGKGATVESVWKAMCPYPDKYEKPEFGVPEIGNFVGWVAVCGNFHHADDFVHNSPVTKDWAPCIYAYPRLNEWQQVYGKDIKSATDLLKYLRAEGELGKDDYILPDLQVPEIGERYCPSALSYGSRLPSMYTCSSTSETSTLVAGGRRAIIGTLEQPKRKYVKIPYDELVSYLSFANMPWLRDGDILKLYGSCGPEGVIIEE